MTTTIIILIMIAVMFVTNVTTSTIISSMGFSMRIRGTSSTGHWAEKNLVKSCLDCGRAGLHHTECHHLKAPARMNQRLRLRK